MQRLARWWSGLDRPYRFNVGLYALASIALAALLFEVTTGDDASPKQQIASQSTSTSSTFRPLNTVAPIVTSNVPASTSSSTSTVVGESTTTAVGATTTTSRASVVTTRPAQIDTTAPATTQPPGTTTTEVPTTMPPTSSTSIPASTSSTVATIPPPTTVVPSTLAPRQ